MMMLLHLTTAVRLRTRWVQTFGLVFGGTTYQRYRRHYHRRLLEEGVTAPDLRIAGPTLDLLDLVGIGRLDNDSLRSAIRLRTRTGGVSRVRHY